MRHISIIVASSVSIYWVAAFLIALRETLLSMSNQTPFMESVWLGVFKVPGLWLGQKVFMGLERMEMFNYSNLLDRYLPVLVGSLIATALALGGVSGLIVEVVARSGQRNLRSSKKS